MRKINEPKTEIELHVALSPTEIDNLKKIFEDQLDNGRAELDKTARDFLNILNILSNL